MAHKLTCIVTGKVITVSNDYYKKKISQYGSEDNFNSMYVSRQVKSLLKRGYKVAEIKDLLKVTREDLPDVSDKLVKEILKVNDEDIIQNENASMKNSDPEVAEYIKNLREYLS